MAVTGGRTLGHILERYLNHSLDKRDKGDKFERLMRSYLTTDPDWADQFSDVWLWSEYPDRGNRRDNGIDLVAKERHTGALAAIQCKFVDPETTIGKNGVDSFISEATPDEFARRIFAHTAQTIGPTAQATLERNRVQVIDLPQMDRSDIAWAEFSIETPDRMNRKHGTGKTPYPYQRRAMADVAAGFAEADRGKLIMACGTGKTYTSLQIMEEQTPADGYVLFLVPSIALLDQTLREWKRDSAEEFRALAVCSDVKVGKNTTEDISTTELVVPATTDPETLLSRRAAGRNFNGRTVVFSTYQSIEVISQAQKQGFPEFDLIICDEAHRTTGATVAGQDESAFTKIHNNDFITGAKRLYMTATPRVFDENAKQKATEKSVVVASMDDERLYGKELHRLGFGEAVEQGLLTDYKVLVLAVDESSVNTHLQRLLSDEDGELQIDDVAKVVGCWNGLSSRGAQETQDAVAMKRAVAFARDIKESKRIADMFEKITTELSEDTGEGLVCRAGHVDGSMNVAQRTSKLNWLEAEPADDECRILTNARCLSEGVDVPTLDAVLFLNPRNSQVDVVQSVGRVMRKAQDKDYGYIILPVGIRAGEDPATALKDNKKYKVIWSVLNALRSHDDRFEANVNKIDLGEDRKKNIEVMGVGFATDDDNTESVTTTIQPVLTDFPGLETWKDAIYAKIVEKVGDREYWENWAGTIADVATRHTERISVLVRNPATPRVAEKFDAFVKALKQNLNQGVTDGDAISMLSQHLITKPVFDALFEGYDFVANNPVSQVMQQMIDTLQGHNLDAETESLNSFYESVARRASGIKNPEGKQRIISDLYEDFFKKAFPKQADALGVVYTPVQIVDFMVRAVDHLSKEHFGVGISDEGVHVLDPFTGTGTFIVRLLQSGVISPHDLARKYAHELHANEIMLLAYYIAAVNIESTYHGLLAQQAENQAMEAEPGTPYVPFEGIVLGDTFQMTEDDNTFDLELFTNNNERAQHQLDTDLRVILGNPPWRAGQKSGNDNRANQSYPTLDSSIRDTYAAQTSSQLKRSLYDSYIRAIRWGTDRIGDRGILAYVSNGGYIDSNSADGLRKTFTEDFDHLYIFNLRGGDPRTGGKSEGGNVFDVMVTVAIMIGVKDPTYTGDCVLHYRDIGDYLTTEEKLRIVDESTIASTHWGTITPNTKGEWINQSSDHYDTFPPLGDKKGETGRPPVFTTYSRGLASGRDAWVYNFSREVVERTANRSIEFYNSEVERLQSAILQGLQVERVEDHLTYDDSSFKWDRVNRSDVLKGRTMARRDGTLRLGHYRPFIKQNVYFDLSRRLNNDVYQLRIIFPTPKHSNHGFYIPGLGTQKPFATLAMNSIPDLNLWGSEGGQFFPRYTWEPVGSAEPGLLGGLDDSSDETVVDDYRRIDNITDLTLERYQKTFGADVTKDAIFAHLYALLHSEQYRTKFTAELKRQLPRIPLPRSVEDFWAFTEAGQALLDLHIGYESVDPYPLNEEHVIGDDNDPAFYTVQKMRWGGTARAADKSRLVYNANVTLAGIPETAHEYILGSRSALEWLIDRYQVKTDKASGIVNDPNTWAGEHDEPRYIVDLIKKVTAVSVETVRITRELPALDLQ